MTTPSVPRCGRMDPHGEHVWKRRLLFWKWEPFVAVDQRCTGIPPVTEGGARCQHCGHVVCTCDAELARERHEEWYS